MEHCLILLIYLSSHGALASLGFGWYVIFILWNSQGHFLISGYVNEGTMRKVPGSGVGPTGLRSSSLGWTTASLSPPAVRERVTINGDKRVMFPYK